MLCYPALSGPCLLQLLLIGATSAVREAKRQAPAPFTDFTNNVVFVPGADYTSWQSIYARSVQLPDESLLMTWENYAPEPPLQGFPVYKSVDGGATWAEFSTIRDTVNGWGLRYNPFLFTLPQDMGGYAAGTLLASGESLPPDLSQAFIDLYASTDSGETWQFVSHVVYGDGPETTPNGNDAIWEPFLMVYDGQLICFFSDQRDDAHAQKLAHVTTTDLRAWSDPIDDVAYPEYTERPGMPVVAHIESTDRYIMTFEICGSQSCAVYYKVANTPLIFNTVGEWPLVSNDAPGTSLYGSPYVIWTPNPAKNDGSGLIIANGNSEEAVFVNDDSADPSGWRMVEVGQWACYSRQLSIIKVQGSPKLMLSNGGNMGVTSGNYVCCGVVEIPT